MPSGSVMQRGFVMRSSKHMNVFADFAVRMEQRRAYSEHLGEEQHRDQ